MNYDTAWVYTCGICCIYPAVAFAAGVWVAKYGTRIDIKNINWKFWNRNHDR